MSRHTQELIELNNKTVDYNFFSYNYAPENSEVLWSACADNLHDQASNALWCVFYQLGWTAHYDEFKSPRRYWLFLSLKVLRAA